MDINIFTLFWDCAGLMMNFNIRYNAHDRTLNTLIFS